MRRVAGIVSGVLLAMFPHHNNVQGVQASQPEAPTAAPIARPERASRSIGPNDERLVRMFAWAVFDSKRQRDAFVEIVRRESSFDHTATNERNGRYGFAQALPDDYESAGIGDYRNDGAAQLAWMRKYILHRYGTPKEALKHHDSYGWY